MIQKEKIAVVVGGTGQIGKAIVASLVENGYGVAVVAKREHRLEEEFPEIGITMHRADFTDEDQVRKCLREIKAMRGRVDFLIYAAGIEPDPDIPLAEYPTDAWVATFSTYVTGFFLCFREGIKIMERGGHIVALSSAVTRFPANSLPSLYIGHYAAAKAALNELIKWARRESREKGILLSRLAPGAVETPYHQNAPAYRKPQATLPMRVLTEKIVSALMHEEETDQEMVAHLRHDDKAPT